MVAERRFHVNNVVGYTLNITSITKSGICDECNPPAYEETDEKTQYIQITEREFSSMQEIAEYLKSNPSIGEVLVCTGPEKSKWIVSPDKTLERVDLNTKVRSIKAISSPVISKYSGSSVPKVWLVEKQSGKTIEVDIQLLENNFVAIYWDENIQGTLFIF